MCSDLEVGVLSLLRDAHAREIDELQAAFISRIVDFVASDECVQFAERVARELEIANDTTRYTIWLAYDDETRNQAIVRLARVEGESN